MEKGKLSFRLQVRAHDFQITFDTERKGRKDLLSSHWLFSPLIWRLQWVCLDLKICIPATLKIKENKGSM